MRKLSNKPGDRADALAGDATSRSTRTRLAAWVYPSAWIAGLSVTAASTDVAASGSAVLKEFSTHQTGAALQWILTQGLAPCSLLFVLASLRRVASGSEKLASVSRISGTLGAIISLSQCLAGLWLTTVVVRDQDASSAGLLKDAIDRADGVKMLAFAVMAWSGTVLLERRGLAARWLKLVGFALTVSITVSGLGYLLLNTFLAYAAWVSLPLLLVWVAGVGIVLGARSQPQHRSFGEAPK